MFGGLANCPVCWDGPGICHCTQKELVKYYNELKKLEEKRIQSERQRFHDLVDASYSKMLVLEEYNFPLYLAKQILKQLTRGQWESLRKDFDRFFEKKKF